MNNEKFIVEQQISNHPLFPDVERFIQIFFPLPNALDETLELRYFTRYMKNGENVSDAFSQVFPTWVVTNNDMIMRRSLPDFTPIPDPDNEGEFLKSPAFDYLKELSELIPLPTLLRYYILDEDSDQNGRFS